MSAVGGSVESVSMRSRLFAVSADADVTLVKGGFENTVESNGDGSARLIKKRVPWRIDGAALVIDDAQSDQDFLQEIADGNDFVPMTITLADGTTYEASGQIVGPIERSTQNAIATVNLSGSLIMTQQ